MKIRILKGDKGNIDFDEPIEMTEEQKQKFIEFMKSLFTVIIVENSDDYRTERLGDKFFMKEWTSDEYRVLLNYEDNDKVCEKLGRSWMSVNIQRGSFIPDFLHWAYVKGKDIVKGDTKKLIEEFMAEREKEKEERRKQRMDNSLPRLMKKKENLEKYIKALQLGKNAGVKGFDTAIENTRKQIKETEEKIFDIFNKEVKEEDLRELLEHEDMFVRRIVAGIIGNNFEKLSKDTQKILPNLLREFIKDKEKPYLFIKNKEKLPREILDLLKELEKQ